MKQAIFKVFVGMLLTCLAILANAQALLQLGDISYSRAPAPYLRKAVSISPGFFRAVGGVAFNAVAVGKNGLTISAIEYNPNLTDGERLVVSVGMPGATPQKIAAKIFDWQLVPIARFAASNDGSAMTLFGSLNDREFERALLEEGGRAINYHSTLDNTLVGLRLMQADIMLFDPNAIDLPKQIGGDYVLGKGEKKPNIELNKRHFLAVQRVIEQERAIGSTYSSYVVGDINATVEFFVRKQSLEFSGRPTWTMWDNPSELRDAIYFYRLIDAEREGNVYAKKVLVEKYPSKHDIDNAERKYSRVIALYESKEIPTIINDHLSKNISAKVKSEKGINPIVYDTLTKVMHYRALFKHFQSNNPEAYARFVSSLSEVKVLPVVTTPTVQRSERLH